MRDSPAFDAPPFVAICVLLSSLTFFWHLAAVGDATDEMSAIEARLIPLFLAGVLAGECIALGMAAYIGRRFLGSPLPAILLAGVLFAFNFYGAFLVFFGPFIVQDAWVIWTTRAATFGIACLLAAEIHDGRAVRIGAMIVGPLLVAGQMAVAALSGGAGIGDELQAPGRADPSPGMTTDVATVRKVDFARRPNIYLLAFDALTPDAIASRYIGVPPPLQYTKVLERHGARLLPNAFADREPTRPSLNSLLMLDVNHFEALPLVQRFGFFSGTRRSPVAEIFRHNGYRIQTMFQYNTLGQRKGPYVDFYGVTSAVGICDFVGSRWRFLGYCTARIQAMLQELLKPPGRWVSVPRYAELVRQRIRVAARDGRPWLTLAYVFSPRHVVQSYNYHRAGDRDAYRREFARNQSEAAREIDELIATIREVDPGAIVLVFGDHGALMSRGTEYRDDPEFYVLDRYGVRMAIWPGGVCAREIDAASGGGFITVAMAVRAIITCLSDGLDPVDKSVTYSLPYGDRESYGRYLYESGSGAPIASPAPAR